MSTLFTPPCPICKGEKMLFNKRLGAKTKCPSCGGTGLEADARPVQTADDLGEHYTPLEAEEAPSYKAGPLLCALTIDATQGEALHSLLSHYLGEGGSLGDLVPESVRKRVDEWDRALRDVLRRLDEALGQ